MLACPPQSIWNFISEYPSQFNDLLNKEYPSLPSKYLCLSRIMSKVVIMSCV